MYDTQNNNKNLGLTIIIITTLYKDVLIKFEINKRL